MVKNGTDICPVCGSLLKHRDYVNRVMKTKGGHVLIIRIERKVCGNKHYHRVIPDEVLPFKHYESELIFGVVEGLINSSMLGYEDYPCELTMIRWKSQKILLL